MDSKPAETPPKHRIFIVEDHPMFRKAVVDWLRTEPDLEIVGEASVTGVKVRDRATDGTSLVEVAGVFAYIGLAPNSAFVAGQIALEPDARIPTDSTMRTALKGICAAGAVCAGWPGRAAAAAGDGAAAAIAIDRYLSDDEWCVPIAR